MSINFVQLHRSACQYAIENATEAYHHYLNAMIKIFFLLNKQFGMIHCERRLVIIERVSPIIDMYIMNINYENYLNI